MTSVGFIGLGNMGRPMSARLVAAGHTVLGFDLSDDARSAFEADGGTAVSDLADAAATDVVILMLPNSAIVESVVLGEAFLSALRPDTVIVDMSSSEPLRTRALAARLEEHGVRLVDAPVSGGVKGAVAGTLTIMIGGTESDVDRVRPVLELLGRLVHAGDVGAGHAIKALNNLLSATHLWATSEAMEAGSRFGLDPKTMLEIFNGSSGRSGSTENKWPNFVLPGTFDSGFGLHLMLKDMRIATALAAEVGAPAALGESAVQRWARAADDLQPPADHTEVARWVAEHPQIRD